MNTYSLAHLNDGALLRDLAALVARDRETIATLLAHIAEVDSRKLYVPAGYPSMHLYCVLELRLSEDSARKRIHAARTARRVPAVYAAVADGRLHLSAVVMLAPYLTPENANELLAAATHKTKFEIEQLIADRFPRLDVPVLVQAVAGSPAQATSPTDERAPGRVDTPVGTPVPGPKVTPLSPERYALQLTMTQGTHDKLRYAQELLSHQVRSGDVAEVLDRALDALIQKLEKRKFAATDKPRPAQRRSKAGGRYVPAEVRRQVRKRDGDQCTFVSEAGRRCPARTQLEFDHIDEVARGGQATVDRMRLRCRAHNHYTAEQTFGTGFMAHKRREAAEARAVNAREAEESRAKASAPAEPAEDRDVVPWLRALGFRADEARRAAVYSNSMPDATLEQRVRMALSALAPPHRRVRPG